MNFGEKLYHLRKEKGLTQEALAEKLSTTRQAISKWENNQGYPETEKLLMIGEIFNVSMDYLLKDTVKEETDDEEGYYVSKEMGNGYLLTIERVAKYVSMGLALIALAFFPYFTIDGHSAMSIFPTIILGTLGIGFCGAAIFIEGDQYKILKREPLLFDKSYKEELIERYEQVKKRRGAFLVIGVSLFVAGILGLAIGQNYLSEAGTLKAYYPLFIGMAAIGIFLLFRIALVLDGYKLLARNEEYVNRITFKVVRKLKQRIDEF